jgi:small subunit ribosomal protein S16
VAVKLRLKRFGRRHRAFYRLGAIEGRNPRNGRVIEELGTYDPMEKNPEKSVNFNRERVEYWLGVGAVPSETVTTLLEKQGIAVKKK